MRHRNTIFAKITFAVTLGAASLSFAGDKIEFSSPSQKTEATPRTREIQKGNPSVFDSFRSGGFEGPVFATPQVTIPDRKQNTREPKKDWIFATPEDSATAEHAFHVKKENSDSNDRNTTRSEKLSTELKIEGPLTEQGTLDLSKSSHDTLSNVRSRWQQPGDFRERQFSDESLARMNDLLKDSRDQERDRFATHTIERRTQFEQLFQPRTIEISKGLAEATSPTRNSTIINPDDLASERSQNEFSRPFKDVGAPLGARSFSLNEDLNPRGRREETKFEDKREELRAKPQPAVLPFPQRPGEIFKRPGSF